MNTLAGSVTLRSISVGFGAELTPGTLEAILTDAGPIATEAVYALPISRTRIHEASWTWVAVRSEETFTASWYLHSHITISGTTNFQVPCSAAIETLVCEDCRGLRVSRTFAPVFHETPHASAQFHLSLCFIASVGKDREDGGRNENSGQCVNSAVFGSDLGFIHGHVVCQNLPFAAYVKYDDLVGHASDVKCGNQSSHFQLGKCNNVVSDEFQKFPRALWRQEVIEDTSRHITQCFITWNKNGVWLINTTLLQGLSNIGFL